MIWRWQVHFHISKAYMHGHDQNQEFIPLTFFLSLNSLKYWFIIINRSASCSCCFTTEYIAKMVSNANNLMIVCQIIFYQMDLNQLDQRLHFVMTWKLITFANPNKPGQAQLVLASTMPPLLNFTSKSNQRC